MINIGIDLATHHIGIIATDSTNNKVIYQMTADVEEKFNFQNYKIWEYAIKKHLLAIASKVENQQVTLIVECSNLATKDTIFCFQIFYLAGVISKVFNDIFGDTQQVKIISPRDWQSKLPNYTNQLKREEMKAITVKWANENGYYLDTQDEYDALGIAILGAQADSSIRRTLPKGVKKCRHCNHHLTDTKYTVINPKTKRKIKMWLCKFCINKYDKGE